MALIQAAVNTIKYRKGEDDHDLSERKIVPTQVPLTNIKAIDVSDLTDTDATEIANLVEEYQAYTKQFVSNMFNFEDWVSQTKHQTITPKWRTFTISKIV